MRFFSRSKVLRIMKKHVIDRDFIQVSHSIKICYFLSKPLTAIRNAKSILEVTRFSS